MGVRIGIILQLSNDECEAYNSIIKLLSILYSAKIWLSGFVHRERVLSG